MQQQTAGVNPDKMQIVDYDEDDITNSVAYNPVPGATQIIRKPPPKK